MQKMPRSWRTRAGSPGVLQYDGGVGNVSSQTSALAEVVGLVVECAA